MDFAYGFFAGGFFLMIITSFALENDGDGIDTSLIALYVILFLVGLSCLLGVNLGMSIKN